MSDETEQEAPEAVEDAPEAEAAVATEEAPADEAPADQAAEPVAEVAVVEEIVEEEGTPAEEYEVDESTGPRARAGLATLYLCERGHRTLSIWSEPPTTCHAPISAKDECGRPVYHSTELPEQVQKALNPLKASKKSSKG